MKLFALSLLALTTQANAKEVVIHVNGMVCGFCAQGIEKKFKSHPEVKGVAVSLEKKEVVLSFDDTKDLSDETITTDLKNAGYNVEQIERKKP